MRQVMTAGLIAATLLSTQQAAPHTLDTTMVTGVDADSKIEYALISTEGKREGGASAPRLTAQCTKAPSGKLKFELRVGLGAGSDPGEPKFYPPWKPSPGNLYPPRLEKATVTMEFLGYTKVKPVKRMWTYMLDAPSEIIYATPGMDSSNMEDIRFYMQYLRSLPTLRLTIPGKGFVEWETTKWQAAVRAEPLCAGSGL